MSDTRPDAYALLESSFQQTSAPKLKSHKQLPRRRDDLHTFFPASQPLMQKESFSDDDMLSQVGSESAGPLKQPIALSGADTGLPPTPPSHTTDETSAANFSPPPHADGVVSTLMSQKSSLSTPINQRSPPTPDPSPPRTTESLLTTPERPPMVAYPSSRAESFKTAREEQVSSAGSRSSTPLVDRLSTVEEDRGLGLAFERGGDATPTNAMPSTPPMVRVVERADVVDDHQESPGVEDIPNREWNTELMRNVTIRPKRTPTRKEKNLHSLETSPRATGSTPRRSSSLRERVEASANSPHTPSIENFAQSIGWPTETKTMAEHDGEVNPKRLSGSSVNSTVVEAMVIVTPPQRRKTLRHSGRNLAYRRDADSSEYSSSLSYSNRNSMNSDDVPLHKLVHKRVSIADRKKRISSESDTLPTERTSSPWSLRKGSQDSTAATLAHQESVRNVLQPAAEILSRSNSRSRSYSPARSFHKRIVSAPEPSRKREVLPDPKEPQTILEQSPPQSPSKSRATPDASRRVPRIEKTSPSTTGYGSHEPSAIKVHKRRVSDDLRSPLNVNKSLPKLPQIPVDQPVEETPNEEVHGEEEDIYHPAQEHAVLSPLLEPEAPRSRSSEQRERPQRRRTSSTDTVPTIRRTSFSARGRSSERRRSSTSQDRSSTSRDTLPHPHHDLRTSDDLPRHSYEWHLVHADEHHRRISFDRSTTRTSEEHAMARHLYATTPFSQFSDTPSALEVSEATAVSIFPHNNHSLLVVQQVARSSTQGHLVQNLASPEEITSPPLGSDEPLEPPAPPVLTVEPSTPPRQISLPVPGAVDSPLKNPRPPPEPPVIKFIPPTPAEELEKELHLQDARPGPPSRSDSHPQRRLSLVQRARRYSDNLISPFLARATSTRGRALSESHTGTHPKVPNVNDEDGSLHPFWRPRGFWEGFEDSDSDDEDDVLPAGGDTSDVEPEPEPTSRLGLGVLGRRFTGGLKTPGAFLVGNSLGIERAGTNKRRPHLSLPARPSTSATGSGKSPRIFVQSPTWPTNTRSPRIEKRSSRSSLRSSASLDRGYEKRVSGSWRKGKSIPGSRLQVQYIGLSGVKERFKERKAEKRRAALRRSIGARYYVDRPGTGPA